MEKAGHVHCIAKMPIYHRPDSLVCLIDSVEHQHVVAIIQNGQCHS